jgi:hypothetical protein
MITWRVNATLIYYTSNFEVQMLLDALERWMWYLNTAAAVVLLAHLLVQRLASIYPALFAYLLADSLEQVIQMAVVRRAVVYGWVYGAGQTVKVLLAMWVVVQLYRLALVQQPGLAQFGRRTLGYLFSAAIVISVLGLFLDAGIRNSPHPILRGFLRFERTVDLVTLVALMLVSGFLLWFPVRARRNVALCIGGFVIYNFVRWSGLLVVTLQPAINHKLGPWILAGSLACLVGWIITLRISGEFETTVTGHRWNAVEAERLSLELDAINSRLLHLARS